MVYRRRLDQLRPDVTPNTVLRMVAVEIEEFMDDPLPHGILQALLVRAFAHTYGLTTYQYQRLPIDQLKRIKPRPRP